MAVINRNHKDTRIVDTRTRGTGEALLAGPAYGSNKFTVRRISLMADGFTARVAHTAATVYFVHQGSIALSHHEGELDILSPGDTAIVHPDEIHHLHNIGKTRAQVIKVASQ